MTTHTQDFFAALEDGDIIEICASSDRRELLVKRSGDSDNPVNLRDLGHEMTREQQPRAIRAGGMLHTALTNSFKHLAKKAGVEISRTRGLRFRVTRKSTARN